MDNESETETDPVYYEAESFYATPAGHTAASSDHSKSFNDNDVSVYEMSQAMQAIQTNNATIAKAEESEEMETTEVTSTTTGDVMSKAISEPIQIYLNCLLSDTVHAINDDGGSSSSHGRLTKSIDMNNELVQDDVDNDGSDGGSKPCAIAKSYSDNTLARGVNDTNAVGIRRHSQLISHSAKANALNVPTIRQINKQQTTEQSKLMGCDDETASNCDAGELLTPVNETNAIPMESATESMTIVDQPELNDIDIESNGGVASEIEPKPTHKTTTNAIAGHCKSAPPATIAQKCNRRFSTAKTFTDGKYKGKATHSDGNVFNIFYTISSQELPCGRRVTCVWICRDMDDDDEEEYDGKHPNLTLTFNSITSNAEISIDGGMAMGAATITMTTTATTTAAGTSATTGTAKRNSMNVQTNLSSRPNSVSLLSQYDDEQVSGEYNKHYTSLKQIGKGAFGYVKLSFRHSDRLLVVTKFILKDKLPPQFMVVTDDKKEIPMEVYLLSTLKHPNVVTVLDVFENEKFFQLVMEKHGSGMDLFEFIDRRPLMDEQLGKSPFFLSQID